MKQAVDLERFAIAGRPPRAAYAPQNVEELVTLVRAAHERDHAIVFFGGGTLQALGNPPTRYDVAIALDGLHAMIEHEPRDLTIAVGAGMTAAALDRALATHGQCVPLDAPLPERGTVGGLLASGWAGPRRLTYGRPRDLVIGTTVVLADGTVASSGGMVVKNVTGYDMSKLFAGSLGTLGALVRLNFKALPRPPSARVALASLPELTRERTIKHVTALSIEPTAALMIEGFEEEIDGADGDDGRLLLLFEGSSALIERATRECRAQLGAAGLPETRLIDRSALHVFSRAIDAYVAPRAPCSITYRSAGDRSTLVERANVIAESIHEAGMIRETMLDLLTGDIIARVSAPTLEDFELSVVPLDDAVHERLDRLATLSVPEHLRAELSAWGTPPASLAYLRALKGRFDPRGGLAPGRLVGGI
ncbi:MAG TPA: FAD-binding oxidoreductase [Candidatus Baltobacteraceae bacterium]